MSLRLCHAVTGCGLGTLELPTTLSTWELRAAAAKLLARPECTVHLLHQGEEIAGHSDASLEELLKSADSLEVLFGPGTAVVATAGSSIWHGSMAEEPKVIHTSLHPVTELVFARSCNFLALRTTAEVRVLDVSTLAEILVVEVPERMYCDGPSPKTLDLDSSKLAFLQNDLLRVFDLQLKECIFEITGCSGICTLSPDGQRVITGGDDFMTVWDLPSQRSWVFIPHVTDGYFTAAIFSPSAKLICTASREPNWEEVNLWNEEGRNLQTLNCAGIYNMVFLSETLLVGIAEDGRRIEVLEVPGREIIATFSLDAAADLRSIRFLERAQGCPGSFLVTTACDDALKICECVVDESSGEKPTTWLKTFHGFAPGIEAVG